MQPIPRAFGPALRNPAIAGVQRYGVSWVRVGTAGTWGLASLIMVTTIWFASRSAPRSEAFLVFVALLAVFPVVFFAYAARSARRIRKYGRLPLTLDPATPRRGSWVRLQVGVMAPPDARLIARVSCVRFEFRRAGRNYMFYGETVWESQTPLASVGSSSVEAVVVLPTECPASALPTGNSYMRVANRTDIHGWLLEVFDETGTIPVRGYYRLPVE